MLLTIVKNIQFMLTLGIIMSPNSCNLVNASKIVSFTHATLYIAKLLLQKNYLQKISMFEIS